MSRFSASAGHETNGDLHQLVGVLLAARERSRLNSPISAKQRVLAVLKAREGGTEEKLKTSPVAVLKASSRPARSRICRSSWQRQSSATAACSTSGGTAPKTSSAPSLPTSHPTRRPQSPRAFSPR
jgi:hypothetical protein